MALFEYKAVAPNGETVQGTMEALSQEMVIARLQEAGNIPLLARPSGEGLFNLTRWRLSRQGMSTREMGEFTQQLATLLGAGLPLDRSLSVLVELAGNERVSRAVTEIRDSVRGGGSLILLLVYVIPQFEPIFEDLGSDLPLVTRVVLFAGEILQNYWWALAALVVLAIVLFRRMLQDEAKKLRWDGRVLGFKWVGDLVAKLETARLSRTLGTLLVNGVPLLGALGIGSKVVGNSVLRAELDAAAREVKTGGGLARNLAQDGHFPRLALQMISVGEETGQLDSMLLKVADSYDREVRNTIDRLLAVFTPVVTLLMAVLIGTIVMSVLIAIVSVNDLVA